MKNFLRLGFADAGDFFQPFRFVFQNAEGVHTEMRNDAFGHGRAQSLDQAGAQVFFHAGFGFRAQDLIGRDFDLFAVIPVFGNFAVQYHLFAGRNERQNAHGADLP